MARGKCHLLSLIRGIFFIFSSCLLFEFYLLLIYICIYTVEIKIHPCAYTCACIHVRAQVALIVISPIYFPESYNRQNEQNNIIGQCTFSATKHCFSTVTTISYAFLPTKNKSLRAALKNLHDFQNMACLSCCCCHCRHAPPPASLRGQHCLVSNIQQDSMNVQVRIPPCRRNGNLTSLMWKCL